MTVASETREDIRESPFEFDQATHRYKLAGKLIPSVTQVLSAILGEPWRASDWFLQRGKVVHACCALIVKGVKFEHDPRIVGQVVACRQFLADFGFSVVVVEAPLFSKRFQYAGTPDLTVRFEGKSCVVDYKASLTSMIELQLGAYGELAGCDWGMGVELREDGKYATTGLKNLKQARREFLSLRTTYGILERLNRLPKEEDQS